MVISSFLLVFGTDCGVESSHYREELSSGLGWIGLSSTCTLIQNNVSIIYINHLAKKLVIIVGFYQTFL